MRFYRSLTIGTAFKLILVEIVAVADAVADVGAGRAGLVDSAADAAGDLAAVVGEADVVVGHREGAVAIRVCLDAIGRRGDRGADEWLDDVAVVTAVHHAVAVHI
jgi:hypothetical protein